MARRHHPIRVLLVDDSAPSRSIRRAGSESFDEIEITRVSGAPAALARVESGEADLILVDWNLREMACEELIRRVRRVDRSLPVIYVAGEPRGSRLREAMRAGADACMAKPICAKSLAARLWPKSKNRPTDSHRAIQKPHLVRGTQPFRRASSSRAVAANSVSGY